MAKIHKFQGDITKEVANSLKDSIAIDTEATGLQIWELRNPKNLYTF